MLGINVTSIMDKIKDTAGSIGSSLSNLAETFSSLIGTITSGSYTPKMEKRWEEFKQDLKSQTVGINLKIKEITESNYTEGKHLIGPQSIKVDDTKTVEVPRVFGMPFSYTQQADKDGRTYEKTFLSDMPIITFTPGYPKYNMFSQFSWFLDEILDKTDTSVLVKLLTSNGINEYWQDHRFYTFTPTWKEYYSYVNTMIEALKIKMGLTGPDSEIHDIDPLIDSKSASGKNLSVSFYVDGLSGGNLAENFSNTFTSSSVEEKVNEYDSNSKIVRELEFLSGAGNNGFLTTAKVTNVFQGVTSSLVGQRGYISDLISDVVGGGGVGGTIGTILKIIQGAGTVAARLPFIANTVSGIVESQKGLQLIYPQIWSDSSYARSININFKFYSPYGDPASIFKHVYVPLFALLGFVMPRQAGLNGYISPMIIRADIPGLFTLDMAYISDLSITKGGSENLWTIDNYPRQIDVSLTLTDLYPAMMMTKRLSYLHTNPAFMSFLDGYAGLNTRNELLDPDSEASLVDYFQQLNNRVSGKLGNMDSNLITNKPKNKTYENSLQTSLSSGIRSGIVNKNKKATINGISNMTEFEKTFGTFNFNDF